MKRVIGVLTGLVFLLATASAFAQVTYAEKTEYSFEDDVVT